MRCDISEKVVERNPHKDIICPHYEAGHPKMFKKEAIVAEMKLRRRKQ